MKLCELIGEPAELTTSSFPLTNLSLLKHISFKRRQLRKSSVSSGRFIFLSVAEELIRMCQVRSFAKLFGGCAPSQSYFHTSDLVRIYLYLIYLSVSRNVNYQPTLDYISSSKLHAVKCSLSYQWYCGDEAFISVTILISVRDQSFLLISVESTHSFQ